MEVCTMKYLFLLVIYLATSSTLACDDKLGRRSGTWRRQSDASDNQEWREDASADYPDRSDEEAEESVRHNSYQAPAKVQTKSYTSHSTSSHRGGYNHQPASVKLKPAALAIVCTVKDPLEHIVWLQARCPDEYDRGDIIAKGSVSLLPTLFSVSVSGEEGEFSSTLTLNDPTAHGSGGVFRCEAWPHFGYGGRHRRQITPKLANSPDEQDESVSDRTGRAMHDPWNAIIVGGTELIDECFSGHYDDKWRKFRVADDDKPRSLQSISERKLDQSLENNQQPIEATTQPASELFKIEPPFHLKTASAVRTQPPFSSQQPNQRNVKLYRTYDAQQQVTEPSTQEPNILLSELNNPEARMQFLKSLTPEQFETWRSMQQSAAAAQENSQQPVRSVEIRTNMMQVPHVPTQGAHISTPVVRVPKSGLEVRTNMVPLDTFTNRRLINVEPQNLTQSS